jgi:hypothetical protein
MALLIAFLILGVILLIAAVLIFREAQRMQELPPLAVIDPDDAYEYVVANLDSIVAATLTHDDVRIILDAALEYLVSVGVARSKPSADSGEPLVLDALDFVLAKTSIAALGSTRSEDTSEEGSESGEDALGAESVEAFLSEQVDAVLDLLTAYLSRVGAVGRPATDGETTIGA